VDGTVLLDEFRTLSASLSANQDPLLAIDACNLEWLTSQRSWRIVGGCTLGLWYMNLNRLAMANKMMERWCRMSDEW